MRRILPTLALILAATAVQAEPRPVVVELFTSQGCSSCPPADALLGELAERDDVIALAFHVDYWNHLGWSDPFASAAATARQRAYQVALGLRTVYTPQMVIDGRVDVVGSDRRRVLPLLGPRRDGVSVRLSRQGDEVEIRIGAGSGAGGVMAYGIQPRAATRALRGENGGRLLSEAAIVRSIHPLGRWSGESVVLRLPLAVLGPDSAQVAVVVQADGPGAVLGAARLSPSSPAR